MQQKWNQNFDGEPMTDIPQKFLNAGCDVYMVMQLRHDEKIFDERFASMRELNRRGKTPDPEHYEVTYYAGLPAMWQDVPDNEVLEELFQMFNISRPQDFEGHSLSVSDIVALKTDAVVSFHYVDSIGFQELQGFMKPENYLKNAEMAMEDDYGMLDGVINNGKAPATEERSSVLAQLKEQPVLDSPHKPPKARTEREME